MRGVLLPMLITVAVVGIVGGIGIWLYNGLFYYRTNDAVVESHLVTIDAPQAGTLNNVSVKKGDYVTVDQTVAQERIQGSNGDKTIDLKSEVNGTVVMTTPQGSVLTSEYPVVGVNQDTVGAVGEATVIAFVDESVLNRLRINQQVDVTIDAYGGTIYTGRVEQIVRKAANQFSDTQTEDRASGNFTKVGQRVPVLIGLDPGPLSNELLEGLNAEVMIHLL